MSDVMLTRGKVRLTLREPENPEQAPGEQFLSVSNPEKTASRQRITASQRDLDDYRETYFGGSLFAIPFRGVIAAALTVFHPFPIFNQHHPLVDLLERSQFKDNVERFARYLIGFLIADESRRNEIYARPEQPTRALQILARRFLEVDWAHQEVELRPPYKIWAEDGGWVEITEDDFRRWADADVRANPESQ